MGLEKVLEHLGRGDINKAVYLANMFLEEVDVQELVQDMQANRDEITYEDLQDMWHKAAHQQPRFDYLTLYMDLSDIISRSAEPDNLCRVTRDIEILKDVSLDELMAFAGADTLDGLMERYQEDRQSFAEEFFLKKVVLENKEKLFDIFTDLYGKKAKSVIMKMMKFCKEVPDLPQMKLLASRMFEKMQARDLAKEGYNSLVLLHAALMGEPIFEYSESRNKCSTFTSPFLPGATLLSKEYVNEGTAMIEYYATLLFRSFLRERVQFPIDQTSDEKNLFRVAGDKTLFDVLQKETCPERVQELFKKATILLADIHSAYELFPEIKPRAILQALKDRTLNEYEILEIAEAGEAGFEMRCTDPTEEDPDYFTHRLDKTVFDYGLHDPKLVIPERARQKMMAGHGIINAGLKGGKVAYYKDHNPRNVIVSPTGRLVAIDFESSRLLTPFLDMISLYQFGRKILSEAVEAEMVKVYFERRKMVYGQEQQNRKIYAQLQRHLELIGYRSRDFVALEPRERKKVAVANRHHHLESAKDTMPVLIQIATLEQKQRLREYFDGLTEIYETDLKVNGH